MKTPAVVIASAFAGGIGLGLCVPLTRVAASRAFLTGGFVVAAVLVFVGIVFLAQERLATSVALSLSAWGLLGLLSAGLAQQPLPADHVITLSSANKLDLHSPLRWYGKLRDQPSRLPWGSSYDIELRSVDIGGVTNASRKGPASQLHTASRRTGRP